MKLSNATNLGNHLKQATPRPNTMVDQSFSLEQTIAHHSAAIAQINEILLLVAQRQQESDRSLSDR